jgi:N-acetylmuramoyl-L-alanine amidase CwlA
MAISITKKTSSTHTTSSKNRSIQYIVIHYTAGVTSKAGSAANMADYFASTTDKVSADFIVDDSAIVQYNPDIANRYSWHCGGSKYNTKGGAFYRKAKNANSIGVEVCSTNSERIIAAANDASWSFTDAVLANAQELVVYLMSKYSIDADHVIRHYDVNGKPCPGIIGWNADSGDESAWKTFKARLTAATTSQESSATCPFSVQVNIATLNIRKGPGTNYNKTGTYTGKGVFTITAVQSGAGSVKGWGKLKSGAGWISLDYCTRI